MHTDGHLRRSCGQSSGWWIMIFTTDLDRSTVVSQKYKSIGDLHVPSVREGSAGIIVDACTDAGSVHSLDDRRSLSVYVICFFHLRASNVKLKCRWPCQPWRLSALR